MLKRFISFTILVLCLSVVAPYAQQPSVSVPGLVAWWKAQPDMSPGVRLYSSVPPYSYLTLVNMAVSSATSGWGPPTRQGSAREVRFDGTNDILYADDVPALNNATAFTLMGWAKQTTVPAQAGIFQKRLDDNNFISLETWDDNIIYFSFKTGGTLGEGGVNYNSSVSAKTWFDWAVVFNGRGSGNAGRMQLYLNGKPQTLSFTGTVGTSTPNMVGQVLNFGIQGLASSYYFNGAMDSIRVYNRALTALEVRAVMGDIPTIEPFSVADVTIPSFTPSEIPSVDVPIPEDIVALWKPIPGFTGGNRLYDLTGRYHGTLTNTGTAGTTSGWGTPTRRGSAGEVRFDGANDYIAITNDLTELNNAPAYTYTAWLKQNTTNVKAGIFMKKFDANNFISIETYNDNKLYADMLYAGNSASGGVTYTSIVTPGVWFHLAVVFNGAGTGNAGKSIIYINGKPQTQTFTGTFPTVSPNTVGSTTWLGQYSNGGDLVFWNGAMDDVRIYNRALSGLEVLKVMRDAPIIEPFGIADITIPYTTDYGAGGIPSTDVAFSPTLVGLWRGISSFTNGNYWYNLVTPNHGVFLGGAKWGASGRRGGSYHVVCDGVNDYVSFPPPPLTGGKYTIMFWAKDTFAGTFGFNIDMTYITNRFILALNGGNWGGVSQGISIYVNGPTYDLGVANSVPSNSWSHIAVTLNAAANLSTGYVNGRPTGTGNYSDTFGSAGSIFNFCTRDNASGSFAQGSYDDLRIYKAELSAREVLHLYRQSSYNFDLLQVVGLPSITSAGRGGFFQWFGQ